ncbi:hypothetical protein [Saccharicrinis fermentans]|uniref:Uncharacterized protein n=1 Tax=Saccharicrinis fermentans DSM 9555 = JCM 21142 TaxID=869213 RepID=W7YTR7_9BACT|nr:hypothetical protein [Saccharicrinis fermentans]GAF05849.1 hypothetical protein JCM21142_114603 [Saccharicrinis fermentans DSM 9555 = JCM 21142]
MYDDDSTYKGQVLGLSPEKAEFYPNDSSQLLGFELGLNGDSDNLFPDASNLKGLCLGLGDQLPFINHSSKLYMKE